MFEARITCLTRTFQIDDLTLNMVKGDVVFIPKEVADVSPDLARAKRAGAVQVTIVQRSQISKPLEPKVLVIAQRHPMRIPSGSMTPPVRPVPVESKEDDIVGIMDDVIASMDRETVKPPAPKKRTGRPPVKQVGNTEEPNSEV